MSAIRSEHMRYKLITYNGMRVLRRQRGKLIRYNIDNSDNRRRIIYLYNFNIHDNIRRLQDNSVFIP